MAENNGLDERLNQEAIDYADSLERRGSIGWDGIRNGYYAAARKYTSVGRQVAEQIWDAAYAYGRGEKNLPDNSKASSVKQKYLDNLSLATGNEPEEK